MLKGTLPSSAAAEPDDGTPVREILLDAPGFRITKAYDNRSAWYFGEVKNHAVAVLVVDSVTRRFVAVRQLRPALGTHTWEIPAGGIDPSEKPAEAAIREVFEETGIVLDRLVPLGAMLSSPGFTDQRFHLFRATGRPAPDRTRATQDDDAVDDVAWFSVPQFLQAAGPAVSAHSLTALLLDPELAAQTREAIRAGMRP